MKTLKKALSVILGLAIMLSCVMGMQVSVAAEGTVALSVGEATVADGVVTVPVVVDANDGFQSLAVEVDYDDAVLELVSGVKNEAFSAEPDSAVVGPTDAETFKMQWAYALAEENVTATGTIATLTFNVVDDSVESTEITLNVTEAWDVDGNEVTATATNGTVEFVKEPVVDSALVVAGASVGYGTSSLQVSFRIRKTVIALYDKVELVIVPQKYDSTTYNLITEPTEIVPELTAAGNFYTYTYTDIQLYELGLNIDYMLRAYDAEGNLVAVSENFSTSAEAFLKTTFANSNDSLLRTLITDTLVVGYNSVNGTALNAPDSDLAKAPSIIEGFDISEATPGVDSYNTLDNFESYNSSFGTTSSFTHQVRYSVSIGKAPYIGFRIKDAKSALDLSKISYKVSYTKNEGVGIEVPYEKTFDSTNTTFTKAGQFITFSFDEIGLQDGNKDIAIELYYDGEQICDIDYSIETYLGSMMSNATVGELTTSLIKLGISFRAYANK